MTEGGLGAETTTRIDEQEASKAILGADDIFWSGYADTHLVVDFELIGKIEGVIKKVKPDFIFFNFRDDTNQNHRHLSQAVMSATRYIRNVLFYEGPTTQNFKPHIFLNISDTLDKKINISVLWFPLDIKFLTRLSALFNYFY